MQTKRKRNKKARQEKRPVALDKDEDEDEKKQTVFCFVKKKKKKRKKKKTGGRELSSCTWVTLVSMKRIVHPAMPLPKQRRRKDRLTFPKQRRRKDRLIVGHDSRPSHLPDVPVHDPPNIASRNVCCC
jgi:hypothetical protein